ncbi:MAG: hypothetical protein Q8P75_00465 [bacterium]|nr:hypothetical protein [bacterium]
MAKNLREFIQEFYKRTYGSEEEWQKAREENKYIDAKMRRADNRESWVCSDCSAILVIDINGNRAKIKAGKNTKVFVKFIEMAAYCENCGKFNTLIFDGTYDWAREQDEDGTKRDTLFIEDRERVLKSEPGRPEVEIAGDYLLKLK